MNILRFYGRTEVSRHALRDLMSISSLTVQNSKLLFLFTTFIILFLFLL